MKILFFGDIFGKPGREALKFIIPQWKKEYEPDVIIANGENMSHGAGISEKVDSGNGFCFRGDFFFHVARVDRPGFGIDVAKDGLGARLDDHARRGNKGKRGHQNFVPGLQERKVG